MIALAIAIHPAHALVIGRDNARDPGIDVDVGSEPDQPQGCAEMRFMGPLGLG